MSNQITVPFIGVPSPTSSATSQPQWVVSPATGSDSNTGAPGSPLATIARWYQMLGGDQGHDITFSQPTTLTCLDDIPLSDAIDSSVTGTLTVSGTLVQLATTMIGVYTAMNRAAGTKFSITAQGQSGSFWTPYVGMTVHDTTANCQFFVTADLGSATAQITQPIALPLINPILSMSVNAPGIPANGNSLVIYRPTNIPINRLRRSGTPGNGSIAVQQATIIASTVSDISQCALIECRTSGLVLQSSFAAPGQYAVYMISCYVSPFAGNGGFASGGFIVGGSLGGPNNNFYATTFLDGNVYLEGQFQPRGSIIVLASAYLSGGPYNENGGGGQLYRTYPSIGFGPSAVWGPGTFNVDNGAILWHEASGGTSTQVMLLTGGMTIDGASTAFPWVPGSHAFGAAVSVTPANVDSNGNLQNPATGSKIFAR